jgi:DNA-binding GntR family transcriptional regulator
VSANAATATATERAYAYTKRRVLDSTYPGGELITEGSVAGDLGLSRTPVREAFLRLEGEGLLRLFPKRGALVVPVSAQEVEAVMETRHLVERFALDRVLDTGAEVPGELEAAIERQEARAVEGDAEGFVEADRDFHTVLVSAAGNPIVTELYDSLRDRQQRMGLAALARDGRRTSQILDEHRALAAAIRARDLDLARKLLDEHLLGTLALLRRGPSRQVV